MCGVVWVTVLWWVLGVTLYVVLCCGWCFVPAYGGGVLSCAGVVGDWTELLWACFGHGFLVVLCGCLVFGVWAVLGAWL